MGVSCALASTTMALEALGVWQDPLDPQSCEGAHDPQVPPQPSSPQVLLPQSGEQAPAEKLVELVPLDERAPDVVVEPRADVEPAEDPPLADDSEPPSMAVGEIALGPHAMTARPLRAAARWMSMPAVPGSPRAMSSSP
jgi:hypothetical protein